MPHTVAYADLRQDRAHLQAPGLAWRLLLRLQGCVCGAGVRPALRGCAFVPGALRQECPCPCCRAGLTRLAHPPPTGGIPPTGKYGEDLSGGYYESGGSSLKLGTISAYPIAFMGAAALCFPDGINKTGVADDLKFKVRGGVHVLTCEVGSTGEMYGWGWEWGAGCRVQEFTVGWVKQNM